jgi:hypothetical protein
MLYAIEDEVRGTSAEQRRAMRAERARVIVDDLHVYLEARLRQVSAKSKLADAIRYALTRWSGLSLFLDDGRVELDSNTVERSIVRWPSIAKTRSSQALTKAETTGRSSPP